MARPVIRRPDGSVVPLDSDALKEVDRLSEASGLERDEYLYPHAYYADSRINAARHGPDNRRPLGPYRID